MIIEIINIRYLNLRNVQTFGDDQVKEVASIVCGLCHLLSPKLSRTQHSSLGPLCVNG